MAKKRKVPPAIQIDKILFGKGEETIEVDVLDKKIQVTVRPMKGKDYFEALDDAYEYHGKDKDGGWKFDTLPARRQFEEIQLRKLLKQIIKPKITFEQYMEANDLEASLIVDAVARWRERRISKVFEFAGERMRRNIAANWSIFYFFLEKFNFDWSRAYEVFSSLTEEQIIMIAEELKRQRKISEAEYRMLTRKLRRR